jgi:polysaccharide biosynthesis/export protein
MTIDLKGCCLSILLLAALVPARPVLWAQSAGSIDENAKNRVPAQVAKVGQPEVQTHGSSGAGKPHDEGFVIGPDDVLAVNVWKEPEISRTVPVRSDGMISLPLAGEVQASGQTPRQLEIAITRKLETYIAEPDVSVIVQEIKSQRFNVLGQVTRPGSYLLTKPMTVLDAIALAGGFRDFAKQKSIYVLRQNLDGTPARLPFNYKEVIHGKNPSQNIRLEPRDAIVVP